MADTLALVAIVGFAMSVFIASFMPLPGAAVLFILLLALLCGGAWFFMERRTYLFLTLFFLMLALGADRTSMVSRVLPQSFVPLLNTKIELHGQVVGDPDLRETNQRIPVEVIEDGVHTKILAVADRYPSFSYGDQVVVSGALKQPEPFATDGGRTFAYDLFLAKDGIYALVPQAHVKKVGESTSVFDAVMRVLYGVKHSFVRALDQALPEPHASLAEGLLVGGKQGLGDALLAAFTIAGLLPIIVLSGYNVMIVAEAILRSLSFLPKKTALAIAAVAVTLFVFAAGAGSSALRALCMALLALFARATGRTYDALRGLAVVFVLMLIINPFELVYDPGFQFSFIATLGLIVAASPIGSHLHFIRHSGLRDVFASTVAAQLFVLPLLLYQTGNLSLVAIPANILVLPFIPITMAASLFAGVVAFLVPILGPYAGLPAYVLLAYIIGVGESAAAIPFAQITLPAFSFLAVIVAYAFIVWFMVRVTKTAPIEVGAVSH